MMERHELSQLWGDMPEPEYRQFAESIRDTKETYNKFIIWTYEGKVLDGWHRYKACEELGVLTPTLPYNGQDPAGFVIRANGLRRHLSPEQRGDAIVACTKWRERGLQPGQAKDESGRIKKAEESLPDGPLGPSGLTTKEMAEAVGVSERTIKRAKARAWAAEQPEGADGPKADQPKPPTKTERLEAQVDAQGMEIQGKAEHIEELEDELRFHRGNMDEQEAERRKAYTALQAELSTARSQINEWMTKYQDERRRANYWERQAKRLGWTADEVKGQ